MTGKLRGEGAKVVEKEKSPSTEGLLISYFSPGLQRSFGLGLGPSRFHPLLEVRFEDILVQAEHQAAALGAQGRVIIKSGYSLVPAPTIDTLVIVDRHN